MDLNEQCRLAVGKWVKYTGSNGDEYDKVNHGYAVNGEGLCLEHHNSHGLCIVVRHVDGKILCVDPITVEVDESVDVEEGSWLRAIDEARAQWAKEN